MQERFRAYFSAGIIAASSIVVGVGLDIAYERFLVKRATSLTTVALRSYATRGSSIGAAKSDLATVDLFGSREPERRVFTRLNPNASVNRAWLLAEGPFHVEGDGRRIITLTFDDGPVPETTPNVLEALHDCGIHASFFVLGQNLDVPTDRAELSRGILRHAVEDGHLVGNHTRGHLYLPLLSHDTVIDEIERGRVAIENTTGKTTSLFRPPFGKLDEFGIAYAKDRNLDLVLWNVEDGGDGLSDVVFERVRQRVESTGGGIVLLHDSRATTASVVRKLCAWVKTRPYNREEPGRVGYEIVDLPTFFEETARSPQPFHDRAELELARAERTGARPTEAHAIEIQEARKAPRNDIRKVRHTQRRLR